MTGTPRLSVADYRRQMGLPPVEPAPVWRGTGGGRCQPLTISQSPPAAPSPAARSRVAPSEGEHRGNLFAENAKKSVRVDIGLEAGQELYIPVISARSHTIVIPGVPVPKGRPRLGNGRAYTPARTAAWERAAKASARAQWGSEPPLEGAVKVELLVILPVPKSWGKHVKVLALDGAYLPARRPDLDNYIKAGLDALNEIAWRDDAQVVELSARKTYAGKPRVEIKVEVV